MFLRNTPSDPTRRSLTILTAALAPLLASAEISPEEARAALAAAHTPARPAQVASDATPGERPLFTPPDALPESPGESAGESSPGRHTINTRRESDGGGFFEFDAGYSATRGHVSGTGVRADLAGAYNHDMGGVTLASGADFGFGRLGASAGYYADHVPWGLALAGEIVAVAGIVAGGSGSGSLNNIPSPYYRLRTELSAIPLSVYYEQAIPLPRRAVEFRFGPLVGGTINIASADYAQAERTTADIGFHYGARAAFDFKFSAGCRLRIGYEYRRMEATDYDLGFGLHMARRDTHTVLVGVTALF